tara:strand:+ start:144 stop:677 length:534 start_codon:yes stop_codon:yes gene_type:complete
MKDDSQLIWEAYIKEADSFGYDQGKGKHWDEYRSKIQKSNPELGAMRAKAKEEMASKYVFADQNDKGRRIPRLSTHGNSEASMDIHKIDGRGEEIGYYEAFIEWSWYGEHYRQTETSPAEEPAAEDIHVTKIVDTDTGEDIDDEGMYSKVEDLIRGELEGEGSSYFGALGMEWDDGY